MGKVYCPACTWGVKMERTDWNTFACPSCWHFFQIVDLGEGATFAPAVDPPLFNLVTEDNVAAKVAALPRKRKAVRS